MLFNSGRFFSKIHQIFRRTSVFLFKKIEPLEQFQEFIIQFYLIQNNPIPKNIYISEGDIELLSDLLDHKVIIPKIGQNLELINLVKTNEKQKIDELLKKEELEYNKTTKVMEELSVLLGIKNIKTIEAFDNSNISGVSAVSAMVSFVDGKPNKKGYRKYRGIAKRGNILSRKNDKRKKEGTRTPLAHVHKVHAL